MSHATVLVIGEDIEEQMAPYDEEISVAPYRDAVPMGPDGWPCSIIAKEAPEVDLTDASACAAWLNARWETDEYRADAEGLFTMSTYNPNSKWDWWVVGGRWSGMLIPKDGAHGEVGDRSTFGAGDGPGVDSIRKGDVDWNAMRLRAVASLEAEWDRIEASADPERERVWSFQPEDTRESTLGALAVQELPFSPHAVLAEGVWREVGRMGWFGCSSDDESDRIRWREWLDSFLAGLPDAALLTVVDYHI